MKIFTRKTRWIGNGLAVLLATGFLAYSALQPSANAERTPAGDAKQAPTWTLDNLTGKSVDSADYAGKVLLIDREGRIRERHVGYLSKDQLEPRIQDLL